MSIMEQKMQEQMEGSMYEELLKGYEKLKRENEELKQRSEVVPHDTAVILSIEEDLKNKYEGFKREAAILGKNGNYKQALEHKQEAKTIEWVLNLISYHKTMSASK